MKYLIAALVALIVVSGCSSGERAPHQGTMSDSNPPVKNMDPTGGSTGSQEMPGGIGVTAGQSGTGTTSGASTGY